MHGQTRVLCVIGFLIVLGHEAKDCQIRVVNSKSGKLAAKAFHRFLDGKPIVFQNLTSVWPATSLWANKESFSHRHGHLHIGLRQQVVQGQFDVKLRDVSIKEYLTSDAHRDNIMFEFGNFELYSALHNDYKPVPHAFQSITATPAFTLGRNGTGSGGHRHEENWLAQVAGRKLWILAAPEADAPSQVVQPCKLLERRREWPRGVKSCVVNAGDVIYLPNMWYHATCNLDDFTLAVGGKGATWDWPGFIHHIQALDLESLQTVAIRTDVTKGFFHVTSMNEKVYHLPLHWAVKVGSLDIVKFLLSQRADPSETSASGTLARIAASETSNLDILKYLIHHQVASVSEESDSHQPIHYAAEFAKLEATKFLLAERADASAQSTDGHQIVPLHLAAAANNPDIITALVEHKANLEAEDVQGSNAIHWAAAHGAVAALKQLNTLGANLAKKAQGRSILHAAAESGHADILAFLLDANMRVDMSDDWGQLPIYLAAGAGHSDCVQLLLGRGTSKYHQKQAAEIAFESGHQVVLKILRSKRYEL